MGKGKSILVVDDVKGQRDLAATMLKRLHYKVASASSGEDAVEYLIGAQSRSTGIGYDYGPRYGRLWPLTRASLRSIKTEGHYRKRFFGVG